ncbi:hypothetical protein ACTVZO_20625 [Streptomyces sp. IBSNAI002]|uniref:hypothetical protein n=1 Tax=Streptomyces sp. IBSNAI002 TaxID=3457500 RepID=UPI003FD688BA
MDGRQDMRQEPGEGRAAQEHQRPRDPARPQPGKSSREQGQRQVQKETSRRRKDDLLREEDLHDENL